MIHLRPIEESSMISHVGYDEGEQLLRIRFSKGAEYEYQDVPKSVHDALMKAPSIGGHFHANIKKVYASARIPQGE